MCRETPGGTCILQPSTQKTQPLPGAAERWEHSASNGAALRPPAFCSLLGLQSCAFGATTCEGVQSWCQVPLGRRSQTLAEQRGHLCAEYSPPSTSADSNNPVSKILENILESSKKQTWIRCTPATAYRVLTLYRVWWLGKDTATHSMVLPGGAQGREACWAAVYGVAESATTGAP